MQLKSHFSRTVEAAIELAREEYEVAFGVVNSPLTPEVLKSPKRRLLKSSLLKQRAAA
jgi:hypothetical protein